MIEAAPSVRVLWFLAAAGAFTGSLVLSTTLIGWLLLAVAAILIATFPQSSKRYEPRETPASSHQGESTESTSGGIPLSRSSSVIEWMAPQVVPIRPEETLANLWSSALFDQSPCGLVVVDNGRARGLLRRVDVERVPEALRATVPALHCMRPWGPANSIRAGATAADVKRQAELFDTDCLVVLNDQLAIGIIGPSDVGRIVGSRPCVA